MRRYLDGQTGHDTDWVDLTLSQGQTAIPPIVITELLSERTMQAETRALLAHIDVLPIHDGYWERAGELRASVRAAGLKAKLADCLIAQSCIDNDASLITYDRDFRHFESAGLRVI